MGAADEVEVLVVEVATVDDEEVVEDEADDEADDVDDELDDAEAAETALKRLNLQLPPQSLLSAPDSGTDRQMTYWLALPEQGAVHPLSAAEPLSSLSQKHSPLFSIPA